MSIRPSISLFIPITIFVILLLPLRNGFTDDGYIHIQYAKNMVERGEYGFNPGEPSCGTTSPLWVMMLASLGLVFGAGDNLIVYSRVLSWLAGAGAVIVMFALARALGLRVLIAWLCALTFAAHAWHVRWTALSMETSFAVLTIAAVATTSLDAYRVRGRALALGFFMALASLLRPEVYLLVPIYVLSVALVRRGRDWSCLVRTLLVYVALVGPWLVFARLHLGQFLPNTAAAKSGGLTLAPVVLFKKFEPVAKIVASTEGVLLLAIVGSILVLRRRAQVLSDRCRFLLLWIIALPVAYVIFDIQILSRYMLLTSPFAVVLGFVALSDLLDRFAVSERARRLVVTSVTLTIVTLNLVLYFAVVVTPSRAFSTDLTHRLKALALFVREHSDDDAVVAAVDIGYLGFYSDRRVLDLGGLVDAETSEMRKIYTYEETVQQGLYLDLERYPHVEFFIDREKSANRFDDRTINGYRFESIRVEQVANLGIRKPGPYFYTLYRLHPDRDV